MLGLQSATPNCNPQLQPLIANPNCKPYHSTAQISRQRLDARARQPLAKKRQPLFICVNDHQAGWTMTIDCLPEVNRGCLHFVFLLLGVPPTWTFYRLYPLLRRENRQGTRAGKRSFCANVLTLRRENRQGTRGGTHRCCANVLTLALVNHCPYALTATRRTGRCQ